MLDKSDFRPYLGGKRVDYISGETSSSDNPARPRQVLGIFQKGNEEDVDRAVEAAEEAFENSNETLRRKGDLHLLRRLN